MKLIKIASVTIAFAVLFAGCAGMSSSIALGVRISPDSKQISSSEIGPFQNNSKVTLEPGRYQGNLEIRANKVILQGPGPGSASIDGDVYISGNSCTLKGLTIAGNVYLSGNNNSLSRVRVKGEIVSNGNNNTW